MNAPSARRALQLLPPCATTGIGSLPHTQLELALQMAFQVDIPYLPQLPMGSASEFMIPGALDGLPGLRIEGEGLCTIDLDDWKRQGNSFGASIESALGSGELDAFRPSPQACRAWKPFLWEIGNRKLAFAKAQLAGPATVRWATKTSTGAPVSQVSDLDQQIFRLILAKCLAIAKAVRQASATPIIYLDEPGLYALDRTQAHHLIALQELKVLALALQREGALVGLHCCGNTDWDLLMDLGIDLLSLDVRLSLDAALESGDALERFLASGASFSLGVIPTNVSASFSVAELVDSVDASLTATFGRRRAGELMLRSVLTPACGLAMRSVVAAEQTFQQLREAQRLLKRTIDLEVASPVTTFS
jgi:hypothetical protein